jgi:hypothetical protein
MGVENNNKNEIKAADGETSQYTALHDPVPLINKLPNISPQYGDSSLS